MGINPCSATGNIACEGKLDLKLTSSSCGKELAAWKRRDGISKRVILNCAPPCIVKCASSRQRVERQPPQDMQSAGGRTYWMFTCSTVQERISKLFPTRRACFLKSKRAAIVSSFLAWAFCAPTQSSAAKTRTVATRVIHKTTQYKQLDKDRCIFECSGCHRCDAEVLSQGVNRLCRLSGFEWQGPQRVQTEIFKPFHRRVGLYCLIRRLRM